ncbi:glycosyltransferase family 2 protein [Halolamina rubra]|uniref:glycosyltransferase family 2 protein n=1 Tax=Halolamina rubra TaxID=1380430 RepID=UPI0009E5BDE6|nr:glycosyltransferase family A protein [Halolamina rubra]
MSIPNYVNNPDFPPNPPPADVDVSVVIPTKDRQHKIPTTIASLQTQEYLPAEIIVVHTGTPEVKRLVDGFPNIVGVEQTEGGSAHARNLGIDHASGDIVAFTDDDCILPPNWISGIVWTIECNEGIVTCGGSNWPHEAVRHRLAARVDEERIRTNQLGWAKEQDDGVTIGGVELRTFGCQNVAFSRDAIGSTRYTSKGDLESERPFQENVLDSGDNAYIPITAWHFRDYTLVGLFQQRYRNGQASVRGRGGRSLLPSVVGLFAFPLLLFNELRAANDSAVGFVKFLADMTARLGAATNLWS